MLKDTLFSIIEGIDVADGRTYRLTLNASHPIFQAHFAGNPILPGACIVQLIKELAANYYGQQFFTCAVKNMKFLQAINPLETPEITVRLIFTQQEAGRISISAVLCNDDTMFSKSTLIFENLLP